MGTLAIPRPRREPLPDPSGELVLEAPPEPEKLVPAGILTRLLPLVMLVGSVGFIAVLGVDNPTSWLFAGMFAISTVGMLASGGGRGGAARASSLDEGRRDYLRYLGQVRRRVREVADAQRHAAESAHPEPDAWPAVLAAGRLWERGPTDADFGHVRVGLGAQRLARRLVAPQTGPPDAIEPVTALALRRFLVAHMVVPDLPIAVALRESATVWLEPGDGDAGAVRALARAVVAQYVVWHSPADARLLVVAEPWALPEWDWVKWLPHNAHPRHSDGAGPLRMITSDAAVARRWWPAEPASRAPGQREPHLLVVADGIVDGLDPWAAVAGVTVVRLGAAAGPRSAPSVVRLRVAVDRLERVVDPAEPPVLVGVPDAMEPAQAAALARRLARYRPTGTGPTNDRVLSAPGLPGLLGLRPGAAGIDALRLRWSSDEEDRLRVPLGVDERGVPVVLDLKEAAQGGTGPHGLCIGATGSGKSELLRTLVLGLAATHAPEALNFVLVDFKGGATFLGLAAMPHVSAVITNLADELTLVDRMADALAGEIMRRQEVLRSTGNLASVTEYTAARRGRPELPPLPALVVVVDEFSELLAQRPEMIDLMVMIGRLGRSLGLHLLLASQRLDEGRLRGLESHLSYRIALKTNSASESRAVLGVPDAHQLPPTPGSAFLATGTDELVRFRGAYVSGPGSASVADGLGIAARAYPFVIGAVPLPERPPADPDADTPTVLEAVISALAGRGAPAHRVWLPPLSVPPPLDEVLGPLRLVPGRGLAAAGPSPGLGHLRVVVGLVDRPLLQRRDPLVVDLTGAAGHLAVVGGPRAGKSSALATVVLALALGHTPTELGVHVLDFGGGALRPLAGLPHVGTVADRQEVDLVRRTVAEFGAALGRRERLFREAGVASVEAFRLRRAAGEFADEPATDLLAGGRRRSHAAQRVRRARGPVVVARRPGSRLRPAPGAVGHPLVGVPTGGQGPPRLPSRAAARGARRVGGRPAASRCRTRPGGPRPVAGWCTDCGGRPAHGRRCRHGCARRRHRRRTAHAGFRIGPPAAPADRAGGAAARQSGDPDRDRRGAARLRRVRPRRGAASAVLRRR